MKKSDLKSLIKEVIEEEENKLSPQIEIIVKAIKSYTKTSQGKGIPEISPVSLAFFIEDELDEKGFKIMKSNT